MQVPRELSAAVRQFVQDFERVTNRWVREGWHQPAEVEGWRAVIREDMQSAKGANSAIDSRPQADRIRAWCGTFRELAVKLDRVSAE